MEEGISYDAAANLLVFMLGDEKEETDNIFMRYMNGDPVERLFDVNTVVELTSKVPSQGEADCCFEKYRIQCNNKEAKKILGDQPAPVTASDDNDDIGNLITGSPLFSPEIPMDADEIPPDDLEPGDLDDLDLTYAIPVADDLEPGDLDDLDLTNEIPVANDPDDLEPGDDEMEKELGADLDDSYVSITSLPGVSNYIGYDDPMFDEDILPNPYPDDHLGSGLKTVRVGSREPNDVIRERRDDDERITMISRCNQKVMIHGYIRACYQHYRNMLGRYWVTPQYFAMSPLLLKIRVEGYSSVEFVTQYITKWKKKIRGIDISVDPCNFIPHRRTKSNRLFIRVAIHRGQYYIITNIKNTRADRDTVKINIYASHITATSQMSASMKTSIKALATETIVGRNLPTNTPISIIFNTNINGNYTRGNIAYNGEDVTGLATVGFCYLLMRGLSPGCFFLYDLIPTTITMFVTNLAPKFQSVFMGRSYIYDLLNDRPPSQPENYDDTFATLADRFRIKCNHPVWETLKNTNLLSNDKVIEVYEIYYRMLEDFRIIKKVFQQERDNARMLYVARRGVEVDELIYEWDTIRDNYNSTPFQYCNNSDDDSENNSDEEDDSGINDADATVYIDDWINSVNRSRV